MTQPSEAKPHVYFLIDELQAWRGTEGHLFRLLKALNGSRLTARVGILGGAALAGEFRQAGIPVHELGVPDVGGLRGVRGATKLARILRREGASLLVSYHTASDLLAPVVASIARVPTLSCRRDEGFTKRRRHVLLQRLLNRWVDGMISVSGAVVEAVARTEGFPRERNRVIWNGEDLDVFRPGPQAGRAALGLDESRCVVTCVAGLSLQKDHATLIRAFGLASAQHPEAQLVLVGEGPEQESLRELARPLGGRVVFLGARRDVPEILRASDVYAQTSTTEGFSNSILQAMATGLPVVATRVGGNPELVTDTCGVLVPLGDVAATSRALVELIGGSELRQRLGRAARQRVERHGSLEQMANRYADAFQDALARRFAAFDQSSRGEA
jgi:glycosyltransferase involved in cell wall biosynthesis